MFDLDAGKILVVGTVALIVVGPKDLPRVLRTIGKVVGKIRRMANEVQNQVMDAVKEADLDGVEKELGAINDSANFKVSVDPATALRGHLTKTPESANMSATSTVNSQKSAELTYASPEMKEHFAVPPGSSVSVGASHTAADNVEKNEIANENIEPKVVKGAMRDEETRKAVGGAL
jgi:sec-independent protein translocase protein TatB